MNYYFITGTSRGIGKALAEILLTDKKNIVFGISRTNSISNSYFFHLPLDLSNFANVNNFCFHDLKEVSSISLVNNSGILGEVQPLGNLSSDELMKTMQVNLITPFLLTNAFMKKYQSEKCPKNILNISSGAGRHPFESWSVYCASKASLDMMSRVAAAEQKISTTEFPYRVFSLAPGIVDTQMQTDIRNVTQEQFPQLDKFIGYYEKKQLASPKEVASKIADVLKNPAKYQEVILDIRNL